MCLTAAVKAQGSASYVQIPNPADNITLDNSGGNTGVVLKAVLIEQPVEVGISNDSMTEITSGLKEGDSGYSAHGELCRNNSNSSSSSFRIPGLRRWGAINLL